MSATLSCTFVRGGENNGAEGHDYLRGEFKGVRIRRNDIYVRLLCSLTVCPSVYSFFSVCTAFEFFGCVAYRLRPRIPQLNYDKASVGIYLGPVSVGRCLVLLFVFSTLIYILMTEVYQSLCLKSLPICK